MMPRVKKYQVAAVFEIGMSEYDSGVIFMPIAEAQAFFNRNQDVTAIEVFTAIPIGSTCFARRSRKRLVDRSSWSTGGSAMRPSLARLRRAHLHDHRRFDRRGGDIGRLRRRLFVCANIESSDSSCPG